MVMLTYTTALPEFPYREARNQALWSSIRPLTQLCIRLNLI